MERIIMDSGNKEKIKKSFLLKTTSFGCGGKTRTYDLRVMSPTSCQLLHPAISPCLTCTSIIITLNSLPCQYNYMKNEQKNTKKIKKCKKVCTKNFLYAKI